MKADYYKFMKVEIEEVAKSFSECKDMIADFICKSLIYGTKI
ncbi:MAG: hypothetical protein NTV71_03715 [Candidatus Omnitrophica bacterium]|nr:hypothetical protein [Candidatus Omnitrophota bacterium]